MLGNTARCLQLYLLIALLSVTFQTQSKNSKDRYVTPQVSDKTSQMKSNLYPTYLVYNNDINGNNETSLINEKMQPELENSRMKELTENQTESDKIITFIPSVKKLSKYAGIRKNVSVFKNATPDYRLKLPISKNPIFSTIKTIQIDKLKGPKLRKTPTSKLTKKKGEKITGLKSDKSIFKSSSLPKEEMIFSKIKNPFQTNSTIEQEVKVINRPESSGSVNPIIRHIQQHMFQHFEDTFPHGGMHQHEAGFHQDAVYQHEGGYHHDGGYHHNGGFHHGGGYHHDDVYHHDGFHHSLDNHHGGHLYVDHSVQHWPWHMSIQEEHLHGWHHLCHGAMVGHHSVLTNAECVYHKPLPSLRVVRHNLIDKVITLDNSSFITARIIHPKYNDYVHHLHPHDHGHHVSHHNLALLHLHHGMGVRPIGLHGHHGGHGHVHGHGHDHCSTPHHNSVQFITNEECDYHFGDEHIGSSHVCAYGLPCDIHHHHGSPLVCSHHGHSPYLVGLSSYQHSCGHHHPTVYERIAPHTDWITSHIK